jgi:hypothetical protein
MTSKTRIGSCTTPLTKFPKIPILLFFPLSIYGGLGCVKIGKGSQKRGKMEGPGKRYPPYMELGKTG